MSVELKRCRSTTIAIALGCLLSVSMGAADGDGVQFTREPVIRQHGGQVRIEFSVSRATDVAVSIVDRRGRTVRHLAAGALRRLPADRFGRPVIRRAGLRL